MKIYKGARLQLRVPPSPPAAPRRECCGCNALPASLGLAAVPVGIGRDVWHHGSLVPLLCQAGERGRVNPEGEGGELGEVPEDFPGL